MEKLTQNQAEKLLKAIFEEEIKQDSNEIPDNYPDTNDEKINYASYVIAQSLSAFAPAITRITRLNKLSSLKCPNVILNNETRIALEHIAKIKLDIDEVYDELNIVFERTKGKKDGNQNQHRHAKNNANGRRNDSERNF